MSDKLWQASKRGFFPYNVDVWYSCLGPMVTGILYLMVYFAMNENNEIN